MIYFININYCQYLEFSINIYINNLFVILKQYLNITNAITISHVCRGVKEKATI